VNSRDSDSTGAPSRTTTARCWQVNLRYDGFMAGKSLTVDEGLQTETLSHLPTAAALIFLGNLINASADDRRCDGARHAIDLARTIAPPTSPIVKATLSYYISNAWATLHDAGDPSRSWGFEQPAFAQQVFHLRCALRDLPPRSSDLWRQILTNLGNAMSHVGRIVEAVRYWDRALGEATSFGMSLGNRGLGRFFYSKALYDKGHRHVFVAFAHRDLVGAQRLPLEGNAGPRFLEHQREIEARTSPEWLAGHLRLKEYSLGANAEEIGYRTWCLNERLFLNPLNDLEPHSIAAQDVLTTPSMMVRAGEGPSFQGFYNQLKQEFVSARFHLFEALRGSTPHFSDRNVLLWDTLDHPSYSLAAERLRGAFRTFYGLFDKLAFFLNCYLKLGIANRDVSFRRLWYVDGKSKNGLRPEIVKRKNWSLRGLYAVSKDLYEDDDDALDAMEPEAQALNTIRNNLEHRYFKVHEDPWNPAGGTPLRDTIAYSITRSELTLKTLHLARLARAGLIYLSLAIHREERELQSSERSGSAPRPLELPLVADEFKR